MVENESTVASGQGKTGLCLTKKREGRVFSWVLCAVCGIRPDRLAELAFVCRMYGNHDFSIMWKPIDDLSWAEGHPRAC